MGRWEPDTPARLAKAALDLYSERGYERTTVAEIAARAGLTERTYFRHYADKREVLFAGAQQLQELFVGAVAGAPPSASPLEAVTAGVQAVAAVFDERRPYARKRQAVITANTDLLERELIKLAALSAALADTLRDRGVPEPAASLTAEAGVAVFKVGFERWVAPDETRDMPELMRETLNALRDMAAGAARP